MKVYSLIIGILLACHLHIQILKGQEVPGTGFSLSSPPDNGLHDSPLDNVPLLDMSASEKSVGKAFFMSLLVPGTGEFYAGSKGQGRFFLGAELLLWGSLLANRTYADILKDDYYAYAVQHAGVDPRGKDQDFWVDIGKFDDLYSFNEQRRRDRFVDAIYPEDENYYWKWDSRENRFVYDGKRISVNEIANRDTYFYAAIVLNHLVSGINAMRLTRRYNRTLANRHNWNIRFFAHRQTETQHLFGLRFITTF